MPRFCKLRSLVSKPVHIRQCIIRLWQLATLAWLSSWAFGAQEMEPVKRWPTFFKTPYQATLKLTEKGGVGKPTTYQTQHFKLIASSPLNLRDCQLFAATAESVPAVLNSLPLPLLGMPEKGTAQVFIYPDEASFLKAGGVPNADGVYIGRQSAILLRADTFLKPAPPADSKLPPKADYKLLVHEFVHLCMHRKLGRLPVWFTEGTAEYISAAHESGSRYNFSTITESIRKRIKNQLANDQQTIRLPSVVATLALNQKSWRKTIQESSPREAYRNYACSLLIVHMLFHGGSKRRQATEAFLEQCSKHTSVNQIYQATESLFPADQCKNLEQKLIKYWRPRGLHLQFTP